MRTRRGPAAIAERRKAFRDWQDRIRDPSLTALLAIQFCAIFIAEPLAARGVTIARVTAELLVIVALAIVVLLSRRRGAIILIVAGVVLIATGLLLRAGGAPPASSLLRRLGNILVFGVLIWVVGRAVYAPGRITIRRLQGAVVVYLNLGLMFATAYGLIWELRPGAFANVQVSAGGAAEAATMIYFSLTTLTTTGYGDIVAVDPFARSLANLESIMGQLYLAITVARLVTMELEDRRAGRPPPRE